MNVIVLVGLTPPERVAESVNLLPLPITIVAPGVVVSDVMAGVTNSGSPLNATSKMVPLLEAPPSVVVP